jgi:hypothetical protein
MPSSKRSQITVFIILAICIVIVLFFIFTSKSDIVSIFVKEPPNLEIEKCLQNSAKQGIETLSNSGGEINPKNNYFYNGNNISYICYTNEYYSPCVMQKPMLKEEIEAELKKFIQSDTEECINAIKTSYERKGYNVNMKKPEIKIDIIPNNVKIVAEIDFEMNKETSQVYKQIKTEVSSHLYNFIMIGLSIASWEARYGDSETMNYMYYHPELKVEKKMRSDGTKIYILTDRNSLDRFIFAIRSFARPPGITGK